MSTNLVKNGAAIINPKERLVNLQKREKLSYNEPREDPPR